MPAVRSRGRAVEGAAKPRPDAYVGLLGLSLLALIVAILFAYLNWDLVSEKPKPVSTSPPGGAARMPPANPPGGIAPNPNAPGPGGNPAQQKK